jgi:hypothetical protein
MPRYEIRVVMFPYKDWWIAQCLDYYIVARSKRLEDLPQTLKRQLEAQIVVSLERGIEPFAGFSPAPKRFWDMYERAEVRLEPISIEASDSDKPVYPTMTAEARLAA